MNKCKINFLVIALVLLVPCLAFALPSPHDPAAGLTGYTCNTACHQAPASMGNTDANYGTNVCLRCHSPSAPLPLANAGAGSTSKTFAPEDYSDPFGTTSLVRASKLQSSHKWFGSDTVPGAAAQPPIDTDLNGMNKNTGFTTGGLFCARCHNIHGTSGVDSTQAPYLRYPNDSDQLCLNCHRSRDTNDHTQGTHPVNVSYTSASVVAKIASGDLLASPVTNPTNPTGVVKLVNTKVVCSTCHRTHNTDSRSTTFDPYSTTQVFGRLSTSKGYLTRVSLYGKTGTDINICTNCHAGRMNHNMSLRNSKPAVQCADCHSGHVEYDAAAVGKPAELVPNVNLVRRYLQYTTAGRVSKRILYRSTTTKEFYNATGNGVCQSCHLPPDSPPANDHYTAGGKATGTFPNATHTVCSNCHLHTEPKGSFSYGTGVGCSTTCHGQPPTSNVVGGGFGITKGVRTPIFCRNNVASSGGTGSRRDERGRGISFPAAQHSAIVLCI